MPVTPQLGLNLPVIGSNNWGTPTNYNWSQLDQFLSGQKPIPALAVSGDVTVAGTVTAGNFAGLDGTFLTSALFNQPNGIPQLNGAAKIPTSLLSNQQVVVVAPSAAPVFNGANGGSFKITVTSDVTGPTWVNGAQAGTLVAFRIVQDGAGNHAWAWPANIRGGGIPAPAPGSINVQLFAVDTDGSLDAATPMMTS